MGLAVETSPSAGLVDMVRGFDLKRGETAMLVQEGNRR
jgi:hypothetical protein